MCMREPLNIVTMVFYLDPKKKKTIYMGKLPTSKRRKGNLFGFSQTRQTHEKKARKRNKLEWMKKWQSVNTDYQSESVSMNIKLVRNTYSPKFRLLAQVGLLPRREITSSGVLRSVLRVPLLGELLWLPLINWCLVLDW